jgi:hypothetical protein
MNRSWINHNSLELLIQAGEGLITGQGSDPQIMMRYSDTYGRTWSNEIWRSMGKIGEFNKIISWNKLGRSLDRLYEIKITDPVYRIISNAYLNRSY